VASRKTAPCGRVRRRAARVYGPCIQPTPASWAMFSSRDHSRACEWCTIWVFALASDVGRMVLPRPDSRRWNRPGCRRQDANTMIWTPRGLLLMFRFYPIEISPDRDRRATKGPGRELRIERILGNATRKTAAISLPRRLPAVRTNTLALLAFSAAISSGRYLSLLSFVSTTHALTDHTEPSSVFLVAREMVIVNFDDEPGVDELSSDRF